MFHDGRNITIGISVSLVRLPRGAKIRVRKHQLLRRETRGREAQDEAFVDLKGEVSSSPY